MSIRPSHSRAVRPAAVALATAVLTVGTVGGVAAGDPPSLDRDPCSVAIAAAGVWPGTLDTEHHRYRLVSDAYDSHLSRRAECSPELAGR